MMSDHMAALHASKGALMARILAHGAARPDAPMLLTGESVITYGEALRAARGIAEALRAADVAPGAFVGLYASRSAEAVLGMLGILMAGGAYVPLDPTHAPESLPFIARDLGMRHAVVAPRYADDAVRDLPDACHRIDLGAAARSTTSDVIPAHQADGEDPAYVMYTSGTTGTPKGVIVPHRAVLRYVDQPIFGLGAGDRSLHHCTIAADGSVFDIWAALWAGAAIAVVPADVLAADVVADTMRRHRVTAICWYAGLHHVVIDHDVEAFASVRLNISGGDRMSPPHAARLLARFPQIELINSYGPTEACVGAIAQRVTPEMAAAGDIPIGRPYEGYEAFLVDPEGRPVGDHTDAEGEIVIAGPAVALGYHGRPEQDAAAFVPDPRPDLRNTASGRVYRTGDLGRMLEGGVFAIAGRRDRQVKVGGRRVELDGIEAVLEAMPRIRMAAVWLDGTDAAHKRIAAAILPEADAPEDIAERSRAAAAAQLGDHVVPARLQTVARMPLTSAGKIDRAALARTCAGQGDVAAAAAQQVGPSEVERLLAGVWQDILGCGTPRTEETFFELGGNSLQLIEAHQKLEAGLGLRFPITLLFETPRFADLAARLSDLAPPGTDAAPGEMPQPARVQSEAPDGAIAVIGMAARLPGIAATGHGALEAFWQAMLGGQALIRRFAPEELEDAPEARVANGYVAARPVIEGADLFDAKAFGILPRDAAAMDPQARLFLELCRHGLDDAGIVAEGTAGAHGPIAVFAAATPSTYLLRNLLGNGAGVADYTDTFQLGDYARLAGNTTDGLATRVAHKLGLTGPAMSVGTACSGSLTAVAQAVACLRSGQAEVALAGGVSVTFPQRRGYRAQEGGMASADGLCRPFDAGATGTVFGDGAGVVVLKRLDAALRDGDPVRAVIRGVGLNNDGADKIAYTAPSVAGQAAALRLAHRDAGVSAAEVGYVECHGTGTALGDPIEVEGLTQAFAGEGDCVLGAVKGNIGHSDAAAGVLGLIKSVMVLERGTIPPISQLTAPNPRLTLEGTPFRLADRCIDWPRGEAPRIAGVSSFGVGGTNAHIVLADAPVFDEAAPGGWHLLPVSARTAEGLAEGVAALADLLEGDGAPALVRVAATLQHGRQVGPHRLAIAAEDPAGAARRLRAARGRETIEVPEIVFLFPGQGAQYPGMGAGVYAQEPTYARVIDDGAEILAPLIGEDIRDVLLSREMAPEATTRALRDTRLTQPALFLTEYACAALWEARGIVPAAMLGHSVGELVAAARAGVLSFEDGLRLIARRGALMQDQPEGAMLSVLADATSVARYLGDGVDLAAVNAPEAQVLAGPVDAIEAVAARLEEAGIAAKRLHTSHAFHSAMMDSVIAPLKQEIAGMTLHAPRLPIVSAVTGTWMKDEDARSPAFWAGQARACVNFSGALKALGEVASRVLVEVGPGATLSAFAARTLGRGGHGGLVQCLPDHTQTTGDVDAMASACAKLWAAGVPLDWGRVDRCTGARRVSLPGTMFQRKRHWVDPPRQLEPMVTPDAQLPAAVSAAASLTALQSPLENAMIQPLDVPGAVAQPPARLPRLERELLSMLSDLSGEALGAGEAEVPFLELGFDSLFMGQVSTGLERDYGVRLSFRALLAETPCVRALAAHLDGVLPPEAAAVAVPAAIPVEVPARVEEAPDMAPVATPAAKAATTPATSSATAGARDSVMQAQIRAMQALFSEQLRVLGAGGADRVQPNLPPAPAQSRQGEALAIALSAPGGPPVSEDRPLSDDPPAEAKPCFKVGRGPSLAGADLTETQQAFAADLAARYAARFPASRAHTARYRPVHADPRSVAGFRPEWKEMVFPVVATRAKGAEIEDADGNVFVDLVNGFGQTAFGHSPDFVSAAVARQMERGYPIGPQADTAGPVAERFARVTGHERVTFCNTGSEAVMAAMRLARAVTGREKIAVFSGDYHGQFDEVLIKGRMRGEPGALPIAPGIPRSGLANMVVLPYGAPETLDWMRANAGDLAAVIVEPVQSRHPALRPEAFVREVREIVRAAGAAFVMDEVVTGFRTHLRGMQGVWGIEADMATYGKVVGGGMPIGVLAGSARWMDALDGGAWDYGDDSVPEVSPTFFAGTFVRHPLVLAAVDAVLDHLETAEGQRLYSDIPALAEGLTADLRAALARRGLPDLVESYSSWFVLNTTAHDPRAALLYPLMRMEGVHLLDGFCGFLTTAHTQAHCAEVLRAFEVALDALQAVGILTGTGGAAAIPAAPAPTPPVRKVPLTASQREIWLTHQLGDAPAAAFNESVSITLEGPLDLAALERAWSDVLARHDALRMRFDRAGTHFDVAPVEDVTLELHDLSGAADPVTELAVMLEADAQRPVAISDGAPWRGFVVRLEASHHLLVLTIHHIACDGWSYGTVLEDLSALYRARIGGGESALNPAPSFAAHAVAETGRPVDSAALDYWKARMADAPLLPDLPTDRPRGAARRYDGASCAVEIPAEVAKAARKAGAKHGCTMFGTLFGALQVVLGRLSGAGDVILAVPTGGQAALEDQRLVGHCVNLLPVRVPFAEGACLGDHLRAVGTALPEAFEHQSLTLGTLVEALELPRDLLRQPLSEVQFNYERAIEGVDFGPVTARVRSNPKGAVCFDLFFNVVEHGGGLRVEVDYNSALYDAATVTRWIGHLRAVLEGVAAHGDTPLAEVPVLDAAAQAALIADHNRTEMVFDAGQSVADMVRAQALRMPDAPALEDGHETLSYAAFDALADAIAAEVQARVSGMGKRIAVTLPRRAILPAALVGILRAGHAYVPLDPAMPAERLREVIAASGAAALLTSGDGGMPRFETGVPTIDASTILPERRPVPVTVDPEDAAYVIYTSGSTGAPKGVEVPHRAMVNFLVSMAHEPGLAATDRLLAVTTVSFDIAVLELFGPLTRGGCVTIATREDVLGGGAIVARLNAGEFSVMQATPTLWALLREVGLRPPAGMRLLAGGEPLPRDLAEALMAGGAELWNMYGPTETTVWSAIKRLRPGGEITIGAPIGNTELHVLDAQGGLLPPGAVGELWIGGAGLARGYLDRSDLTEAAFRVITLGGQARRLYRTGDLAQRRADGEIVVLGRRDGQVKLRGFRIELGEIEARLRALASIRAAAVDKRRVGDEERLVAWIVLQEGAAFDRAGLMRALAAVLPDYMVPQLWDVVDALPQTANGKLDRKALTVPSAVSPAVARPVPVASPLPGSALENRLSAIWREVLGVDAIDPEATLFEMGADSLVVFRIAARQLADGLELEARDLLAYPSIRALATFAETRGQGAPRRPALSSFRGGARRGARVAS